MPEYDTCRGCGRRIRWVIMAESGRSAPVDPEPVDRRTPTDLIVIRNGVARVERVTRGHLSHFATCPKASQFRRKGTQRT